MRLTLTLILCSAACSRSHSLREAPEADRAEDLADDLELAFARYRACRGFAAEDEDVWDGYSRACFTALVAAHLERRDVLATCLSEKVAAYRGCGTDAPCDKLPCASATLLDDSPIPELIKEECGSALNADVRAQLHACR